MSYRAEDFHDLEDPRCKSCAQAFGGGLGCQANDAPEEASNLCLECHELHLRRDACEPCLEAYPQGILDEDDLRHCPRCLQAPKWWGGTLACPDCYDGAPDSGTRREVGFGMSAAAAIASWNDMVENWEESA